MNNSNNRTTAMGLFIVSIIATSSLLTIATAATIANIRQQFRDITPLRQVLDALPSVHDNNNNHHDLQLDAASAPSDASDASDFPWAEWTDSDFSGSFSGSGSGSFSGDFSFSGLFSGEFSGSGGGGGGGGSNDCQPGTYSSTGYAPCTPCGNNSYANIRETSCTSCPVHTHCPSGAASLTECVCDSGYTSLWASGGPCYPESGGSSFEYCTAGTYSSTGYAPCISCGNNSYANIGETECTPCPANSHCDSGSSSITECVCDDGYWSPWATGGPCYKNGENTGATNQTNGDCSSYTTSCDCDRDDKCSSIYGHSCTNDRWSFISCAKKSSSSGSSCSSGSSTCGTETSTGERAWFANKCLPDGWTTAPVNSRCGSCCEPKNHPNNTEGSGDGGNVGGCSFVNGSACVLLEYQGTCPSTSVLNKWRIAVIEAVASSVSKAKNVSKADATLRITIYVLPQTNTGTKTCAVRLQIFPPSTGDLTANDFMEAVWDQFNRGGNNIKAQGLSLSGVVAYNTFGSLEALTDGSAGSQSIISSSSGGISIFSSSSDGGIIIISSTGLLPQTSGGAITSATTSFTIGIIALISMIIKVNA